MFPRFSLIQLFLLAILFALLASMWARTMQLGRPVESYAANFSPNGQLLSLHLRDSTQIWRRTPRGYRRTGVTFDADNRRRRWTNETVLSPFVGDSLILRTEEVSAKGATRIELLDAATGRTKRQFSIDGFADAVRVSEDGSVVVVRRNNYTLEVWNWGAKKPTISGLTGTSVALSPNKRQLLVARSGQAVVYDARTAAWAGTVGRHRSVEVEQQFSPDGRFIATYGGSDLRVWSTAELSLVEQIPIDDGVKAARFSSDSRRLMWINGDASELKVHVIGNGLERTQDLSRCWTAVQFATISSDGGWVAGGSAAEVTAHARSGLSQRIWSRRPMLEAAKYAFYLFAWAATWGLYSSRQRRRWGELVDDSRGPAAAPPQVDASRHAPLSCDVPPNGLIALWVSSTVAGAFGIFFSTWLLFQTGMLAIPTFHFGIFVGLVSVAKGWGRSRSGLRWLGALQAANIVNADLVSLVLGGVNLVLIRDPLVRIYLTRMADDKNGPPDNDDAQRVEPIGLS